MLMPAIPLDAMMTVAAALERLARHGIWEDPHHFTAVPVIEEYRQTVAAAGKTLSFEEAERKLRKDPFRVGVGIRRQWYGQVLWYARPAGFVLQECLRAMPNDFLLNALRLHESDSRPSLPLPATGAPLDRDGVVLDGGALVAISLTQAQLGPTLDRKRGRPRGPASHRGGPPIEEATEIAPQKEVQAWPLLEAPEVVTAEVPFTVVVGLAEDQQVGVSGGKISLLAPADATSIELSVELMADGVDAPGGWTKPLSVPVNDPASARATFSLIGHVPSSVEPVHLTLIEARYVLSGTVCGIASRPLEIRAATYVPPPNLPIIGTPWTSQPTATSPFMTECEAADLTIEIAKPDGNLATGQYVCRLYSSHPISADRGPHKIDFGQDTKTFARNIVDRIRDYATDPIVKKLLESYASAVGEKLPDAAHDALYEVAKLTSPNPPTVLIVSAEPYVPWELALVDPPLDPTLPPFLGVQTLLGRWLRDAATPESSSQSLRVRMRKPPIQPTAKIAVRHMAVMAGMYRLSSGLRSLPQAEKEAADLVKTYDAVPLAASSQALLQLLDARLEHNFQQIGGPEAVHFAGHGDFNPASPDSSVMLLSDGKPLSSDFFRSASYGGDRQPLIFLNACMIGIGGEMLGDMGGFPGNCLKGGFGGVLGALWEVDDTIARDIALEFWKRALPKAGTAEPIAAILRDLRAKYDPDSPVPSYLAYVYYGHPRLTLERVS